MLKPNDYRKHIAPALASAAAWRRQWLACTDGDKNRCRRNYIVSLRDARRLAHFAGLTQRNIASRLDCGFGQAFTRRA